MRCACFQGGFVRQKRLPNDQTNLAERIGLASRYYIKNILSSDQLIPDDAKAELTKESVVSLLQLNAIELAVQIMVDDFTVFRSIEPTEYIDNLFSLSSRFGTPNLTRFGELVNTEMMWVITEVVSEPNAKRRANVVKQFIKVAHHCFKETQNYNAMFAITSGLDHGAVKRLKSTWDKVPAKYLKLVSVCVGSITVRLNRHASTFIFMPALRDANCDGPDDELQKVPQSPLKCQGKRSHKIFKRQHSYFSGLFFLSPPLFPSTRW